MLVAFFLTEGRERWATQSASGYGLSDPLMGEIEKTFAAPQ
jgi:hypothetical protein